MPQSGESSSSSKDEEKWAVTPLAAPAPGTKAEQALCERTAPAPGSASPAAVLEASPAPAWSGDSGSTDIRELLRVF